MAWPVVVGALLTAGGAYAQNRAASRRAKAVRENQQQVIAAQRRAQQDYDERRQQSLSDALDESAFGVEDVSAAQRAREQALVDAMESNRQPRTDDRTDYGGDAMGGDGRSAATRIVEADRQQQSDLEGGLNEDRRSAMARMQSLGDVFNDNMLNRAPHQDRIQAEAGNARRRASRMPLEMQNAHERGMDRAHGTAALGGIMSGVGMGMMTAGAGSAAGAAGGSAAAGGGAATGGSTAALGTKGAYSSMLATAAKGASYYR